MEEQKRAASRLTTRLSPALKTGLMGAACRMGDSIIWAAVMPLLIAILFRSRQMAKRWAVLSC